MNTKLKQAINTLCEVIVPEDVIVDKEMASLRPEAAILKRDMYDYLGYLASSDESIRESETDFIFDYLNEITSPEKLSNYVSSQNIYSTTFETRVPESLKKALEQDNAKFNKDGKLDLSVSVSYLDIFYLLGQEFINCDGEEDSQELEDLTLYMDTLKKYKESVAEFPDDVKGRVDTSDIIVGQDTKTSTDEKTLEELLEELQALIGLERVKKDVITLVHLQQVNKLRKHRGYKEIPVSNHLVFYGNPGTGKTTVARLIGQIYHAMGILSKGHFVETDRSGLVAAYVGQTALKVKEVAIQALGGILFIDEAYSLTRSGSDNDFGYEAVDTLLKFMEDHRDDFIVIVAGYPDLMEEFIDSNPGLKSRFNKYISFEDYNGKEMVEIFKYMCKEAGYSCTDDVIDYCKKVFEEKYQSRTENFANAREVRNFFENAVMKQADRIFSVENPTDEELLTIRLSDVDGLK